MAATDNKGGYTVPKVSTHSHPKVAAVLEHSVSHRKRGFNTQPPEGGCRSLQLLRPTIRVSTHSHPKVAASYDAVGMVEDMLVSTHSHPKVAA